MNIKSDAIYAISGGNNQTVTDPRAVFVVHGRNKDLRDSMFSFLRCIGLHPLEWSEAVNATGEATPYIGDILDTAFSMAQAVVILMTPDDEARLKKQFQGTDEPKHETELTGQARPNVLFEAGMAMGRDPKRTVLVEVGKLRHSAMLVAGTPFDWITPQANGKIWRTG